MKRIFILLSLSVLITGCDKLGTSKVKNLIDLTPKLEIEENKKISFMAAKPNPFKNKKLSDYHIAKQNLITEPVIVKDIVYSLSRNGTVSAFSLQEKKILWTSDIGKNEAHREFSEGGVLISEDKLFVTYGTRHLVIIDSANGAEIIRKEFPDVLRGKPVMSPGNIIIVQTLSNQLVGFNVKNYRNIWMHEGGLEIISSKNQASPVQHNGKVLASYSSGEVVYLDAVSGSEIWRFNLAENQETALPSLDPAVVIAKPIISGSHAYLATSNGKIIKLSLDDGSAVWIKQASDLQSITLKDDNLIVTNNARQVAIISSHTGKTNWVGNLISAKERSSKKIKTLFFFEPFVTLDGDDYSLNVLANNGELYSFTLSKEGQLPTEPVISKVGGEISSLKISCCSNIAYLVSGNKLRF